MGQMQVTRSPAPAEPVLDLIVSLIMAATPCSEVTLFEYGRAARRLGPGTAVASSSQSEPPAEVVRVLFEDTRSQSGASDCFALARMTASERGEILGLRLSDGEDVFIRGYARFAASPTPEAWGAIRRICIGGASVVSELRKQRTRGEAEAAGRAFQSRMLEALRLGSDAYWEADTSGCIRNVVLHASADENLIRLLEGQSLPVSAMNSAGGEFRNLLLDSPGMEQGAQPLELFGRKLMDGSWQGIARSAANGREALSGAKARSMIESLQASRDHEAALRRETELILDGLRILTSGKSNREIFRALLDFLVPALEFEAAIVLRSDWSGHISTQLGSGDMSALDWQETGEKLFAVDEVAFTLAFPEDLDLPTENGQPLPFRNGLALKVRGGSKAAILLCLHSRAGFFGERHVGLGTRLALIASQAFMNEEERQKVVEASKLATIGEMAAGIVHEINQPLTSMTLAVNNLQESLETEGALPADKLAAKLAKLQGQIARVSKIVANMRVLARRTDGALEAFDIDNAVQEAAGIIQHKLAKAEIAFEVDGTRGLHAHGNAVEFSQVILNLVSNAHDAIVAKPPRGTPAPRRIAISVQAEASEWVEIVVRDTGGGFPNKGAEKAFEPFFTTKAVGQGTGLGLSLCRRIMENMGGTIALGNWAQGAEIRLRLKRAIEDQPAT